MKFIKRAETTFTSNADYYKESAIKRIEKIEKKSLSVFEKNPYEYKLGIYMSATLNQFNQIMIDQEQQIPIQLKLLKYWIIFSKAYYTLAYNPGKEVEVIFKKNLVKHLAKVNGSDTDFYAWLDAWSIFQVLRDQEGINLMLNAPKEAQETSEIKWAQLHINIMDLFNSIYTSGDEFVANMKKVMHSLHPSSGHLPPETAAHIYTLSLYAPMIELYDAVMVNNEEHFNEVLTFALESHKKYYDTTKDYRNNESRGWISWHLLAPVSMAYDRGINIKVKSDYLPEWLYKKEFDMDSLEESTSL